MESIFDIMAKAQAKPPKTQKSSEAMVQMPKALADILARGGKQQAPNGHGQRKLTGTALALRKNLAQKTVVAREDLTREKEAKERQREEAREVARREAEARAKSDSEIARRAEEARIKDARVMAALRPASSEVREALKKESEEKWETKHEDKYEAEEKASTSVFWTPACERIYELPEWDWTEDQRIPELIETLTARYKTPQGTMVLHPVQTAMMYSLQQWGGAFGAIGVGGGKTLISFLAPTVLQAKRAVLLVPAKLVGKTEHDFKELAKHWPVPKHLEIISYSRISHKKHHKLLWDIEPELILADEAHALANDRAACTRRVRDFLDDFPNTAFVPMSGTMVNRSLRNFAHLLRWSLGRRRMPLPDNDMELGQWARALDEKVKKPIWVGDLVRFIPLDLRTQLTERAMAAKNGVKEADPQSIKDDTVQAVRDAVGDRINKTRGVIYTKKRSVEASIYIDLFDAELSDVLLERLNALQEEKQGIMEMAEKKRLPFLSKIWQKARQICCGFNYVWDPEPPEEWKEARSKWSSFVLEVLKQDVRGYEAESQVSAAARTGMLGVGSQQLHDHWKRVKPTFTPNIVPEWIDKAPLHAVARRVKEPTLIWTEFQAVGYELSKITGFPFFHRQGKDQKGNAIEEADPNQTLILSIASNSEGRNLQAWHRNLFLTPMGTGRMWEQALGRTHRSGQQADAIYVDIMMGCNELHESLDQAFRDARFIQSMSKNPQKLLLADFIHSTTKAK